MKHSIIALLMMMAAGCAFTACTDAGLCYNDIHPHGAGVKFVFDWGDQTRRPDTMGVVAYRVVNMWKKMMAVNSTTFMGHDFDSTQLNALMTRAAEPQPGDKEQFNIRQGEYKFITFSLDTTEVKLNEVAEFVKSDAGGKRLQDINIEYRQYKKGDPRLKRTIPGWTDYNTYTQYIQPDIQPLYYDTLGIVKAGLDEQLTCTFHPKPVTQNADIYFSIKKDVSEYPFVIDSVWVELSGVPRTINLSNGHLDITRTGKMMFPMNISNPKAGGGADTDVNDSLRCHYNIDVTGIVNAPNDSVTYGPGIMQVVIYTHAMHNGVKLRKMMQGKINLYHTIEEAKPILITPDGQYALRNGEHVVLDINALLLIDGKNIIKYDDGNQGLDRWIPVAGDIIVDI